MICFKISVFISVFLFCFIKPISLSLSEISKTSYISPVLSSDAIPLLNNPFFVSDSFSLSLPDLDTSVFIKASFSSSIKRLSFVLSASMRIFFKAEKSIFIFALSFFFNSFIALPNASSISFLIQLSSGLCPR